MKVKTFWMMWRQDTSMFRVKGGDRGGEDWRIVTVMSALPRRLTTLLRSLSTMSLKMRSISINIRI